MTSATATARVNSCRRLTGPETESGRRGAGRHWAAAPGRGEAIGHLAVVETPKGREQA
jgi:hypothetical protein